jgi:uncharacterized protein
VKVVLDTNVLLSAIATRGVCEAVLDLCVDRDDLTIVSSEHILTEFAYQLRAIFGMTADETRVIVDFLRNHALIVIPAEVPANACRDLNDLPILGTALAVKADYLVTGDKDLLDLKKFNSIPILTPRAFFDLLQQSSQDK